MSVLHELLAVEESLCTTAKKLTEESIRTLNKESLFQGYEKALVMFSDDPEVKKLETVETKQVETTVDQNLDYTFGHIAAYWDAVLQKEQTNRSAAADLFTPDGEILASDVPATFLLGMEAKLSKLRELLQAVPTLPPSRKWEVDSTCSDGVYVDRNVPETLKQEKEVVYDVVYEATPQHPAQIAPRNVTRNVGKYTQVAYCGMWTARRKAEVLGRLEGLIRQVKSARMRANATPVENRKIASTLLDYILQK